MLPRWPDLLRVPGSHPRYPLLWRFHRYRYTHASRGAYARLILSAWEPKGAGCETSDCCVCGGYYWGVRLSFPLSYFCNLISNPSFLFLVTAALALLLNRHHKKEKKYGPGPSNDYTSGTGRRSFFKRKPKSKPTHDAEELGALGGGNAVIAEEKTHHKKHGNEFRPSNDTGMTGSTAAAPETAYGGPANKYAEYSSDQPNSGYNAYNPQTTGTTHQNAYSSTDTGYGHGINQQSGVIHDPQPYAEVHGTGAPHQYGHVR